MTVPVPTNTRAMVNVTSAHLVVDDGVLSDILRERLRADGIEEIRVTFDVDRVHVALEYRLGRFGIGNVAGNIVLRAGALDRAAQTVILTVEQYDLAPVGQAGPLSALARFAAGAAKAVAGDQALSAVMLALRSKIDGVDVDPAGRAITVRIENLARRGHPYVAGFHLDEVRLEPGRLTAIQR